MELRGPRAEGWLEGEEGGEGVVGGELEGFVVRGAGCTGAGHDGELGGRVGREKVLGVALVW